MFCNNCGKELPENGSFCPECGAPVQSEEVTVQPEAAVQPEVAAQPEAVVQPEAAVQPEVVAQPVSKVKKLTGKDKKMIIIGAAVAAAVVLLLVVTNLGKINNSLHRLFMSPEKYYQHVEKETVKELAELGSELYQAYIYEGLNCYDRSEEIELSVELAEDGQEFLEMAGFAGVDLSWIQALNVGFDASVKGNVYSIGVSTNLNSDDILSGNIILDMEDEAIYFQLPELNKKYLGYDLEEMIEYSYQEEELEQLKNYSEYSKELLAVMPKQDKVEKLLEKYINIAISCMDDVDEKGNKTLKVGSVQQKCTEIKVTIDGDTLADILEAVIEEALKDKELKEIIVDVADKMELEDVDGEEVYEEFVEGLEETLDYMDDYFYYYVHDSEVVMKLYVDKKGDIKGRKIEFEDNYYGDSVVINMLMPEKGNNYEFELSAEADGEEFKLSGSGKKSGDKLDGEFQLRYNGASIVEILAEGLDTKELKLGRLNGNFEIAPASKIRDLVGTSVVQDFKLVLDTSMTDNSSEISVGIIYEEDNLGTISASTKSGSASKTSTPGSSDTIMLEDEYSIIEWLESANWEKFASALEKTDIPSEVVDIIEEISEAVEDGELEDLLWGLMYMY